MLSYFKKLSTHQPSNIQWVIVFISLLVAAQVQYIQHGWINPDSVLYLEAAKLFAVGEWKAGFAVFPWPFYSLCIAATHHLTSLSIHHAAQLLNVIFFAIATYAFTAIIQLCGGKQKELITGGLIFLSAQYMIGGVLEMLMRDEGFWAFFLLSIVFLIRFHQRHQLKDALLWQIMIIMAVLFRIEAMLYLVLLPLVLMLNHQPLTRNLALVAKAYSLQIILALAVMTALLIHPTLSTDMLGRLNEIFTANLWQAFTQKILTKSQIMSELVLDEYLEEFALPGLILTFLYVIIVKSISATGIIPFGLGVLGIKNRYALIEKKGGQILMATMLIALLNMALIITKVFVLSGRYVLAISFILMVLASFYFAHLLDQSAIKSNKKSQWIVRVLLVVMVLGFVKNLMPKKTGYNYMQDAVKWLDSNSHASLKTEVFFNETRMRYYAGAPFIGTWNNNLSLISTAISDRSIYQHPFLMIATSTKEEVNLHALMVKLPDYKEIKRFHDAKAKKYVIVYQKEKVS